MQATLSQIKEWVSEYNNSLNKNEYVQNNSKQVISLKQGSLQREQQMTIHFLWAVENYLATNITRDNFDDLWTAVKIWARSISGANADVYEELVKFSKSAVG